MYANSRLYRELGLPTPGAAQLTLRQRGDSDDLIPGTRAIDITHLTRGDFTPDLTLETLKRCANTRVYVMSCYYKPWTRDKLEQTRASDQYPDAWKQEIDRALSREELLESREDMVGMPIIIEHLAASGAKNVAHLAQTCGVVEYVMQASDGSTLVGMRFFANTAGVHAVSLIESGLMLSVSLHFRRQRLADGRSIIVYRETSLCVQGRRPGTGLVNILEFVGAPPPLRAAPSKYAHPRVENIIDLLPANVTFAQLATRAPLLDRLIHTCSAASASSARDDDARAALCVDHERLHEPTVLQSVLRRAPEPAKQPAQLHAAAPAEASKNSGLARDFSFFHSPAHTRLLTTLWQQQLADQRARLHRLSTMSAAEAASPVTGQEPNAREQAAARVFAPMTLPASGDAAESAAVEANASSDKADAAAAVATTTSKPDVTDASLAAQPAVSSVAAPSQEESPADANAASSPAAAVVTPETEANVATTNAADANAAEPAGAPEAPAVPDAASAPPPGATVSASSADVRQITARMLNAPASEQKAWVQTIVSTTPTSVSEAVGALVKTPQEPADAFGELMQLQRRMCELATFKNDADTNAYFEIAGVLRDRLVYIIQEWHRAREAEQRLGRKLVDVEAAKAELEREADAARITCLEQMLHMLQDETGQDLGTSIAAVAGAQNMDPGMLRKVMNSQVCAVASMCANNRRSKNAAAAAAASSSTGNRTIEGLIPSTDAAAAAHTSPAPLAVAAPTAPVAVASASSASALVKQSLATTTTAAIGNAGTVAKAVAAAPVGATASAASAGRAPVANAQQTKAEVLHKFMLNADHASAQLRHSVGLLGGAGAATPPAQSAHKRPAADMHDFADEWMSKNKRACVSPIVHSGVAPVHESAHDRRLKNLMSEFIA